MENIRTVIPNEFVDPHTHILPGIDDGAKHRMILSNY